MSDNLMDRITETTSTSCYIAKSNICVDTTGRVIGDGVFAGSNFASGECIKSLERPLLASLETERLKDTCANCYVWAEGSSTGSRLYVKAETKLQTCGRCKKFRYCGKACQKEAWTNGHKYVCKLLKDMGDKEFPKAVLGCIELVMRKKNGLIADSSWHWLLKLDSHVDDFKRQGQYGNMELMAMGVRGFSGIGGDMTFDAVAALYARILSNSLTLITPTFDPLGIMIDPLISHLNHSCDPNAYVVMDGPKLQLRSLKDIKKGEEIFISYIDPTNPYARRQSELKERWFFDCKCSKCLKGPTHQEDKWAIALKDIPRDYKEAGDLVIQRGGVQDLDNYVGDSLDEQRAGCLQEMAFTGYEEQRTLGPEKAVKQCEITLTLCHGSRLWPPYRQPYAAIRDDMIVNLLTVGDYERAWAHCAKRHRDVIPKLYPEPHHPVRVVQTWQMAMLAQYLAAEGKEVAPGADMAAIAAILINLINTMSKLSHGADSSFARSVQEKFAEVEAEVLARFGSKDAMNAAVIEQGKLLHLMADLAPW